MKNTVFMKLGTKLTCTDGERREEDHICDFRTVGDEKYNSPAHQWKIPNIYKSHYHVN